MHQNKDKEVIVATQQVQAASEVDYIDTSRYERIDGQLVERPLPGSRHSEVQENTWILLKPIARQFGMTTHLEWTLDGADTAEHDWMTPDVLVSMMPGERKKSRIGHLLPPAFLAVEVPSPGQTIPQMMKKAQRYLRWGMRHVWLVEPEQNFGFMATGDGVRGIFVSDDGTLEAGEITVSMTDVLRHEE
jgi:Uma2 family endonuclease